jgi:hypothetical protein
VALYGTLPFGEFITPRANFSHVGYASLTMFRMATGESWNGLMHEAYNDAGWGAYPFFVSFVIVVFFVMVNIIVAVVLDAFSHMSAEEDAVLTPADWSDFNAGWADPEVDPYATGWAPVSSLVTLMRRVPPPLGCGSSAPVRLVRRVIAGLTIPAYGLRVSYRDVRLALAQRYLFGRTLSISDEHEIARRLALQWHEAQPITESPDADSVSVAAMGIVRLAIRRFVDRLRARKERDRETVRRFLRRAVAARRARKRRRMREEQLEQERRAELSQAQVGDKSDENDVDDDSNNSSDSGGKRSKRRDKKKRGPRGTRDSPSRRLADKAGGGERRKPAGGRNRGRT